MTREQLEKRYNELLSEYLQEVNKDFGYNHFKAVYLEKELDKVEKELKALH